MSTILQRATAIQPGSGTTLKNLGVTHKLTSNQTGGAFYLCEAVFGPESGSPLHIHHKEDEVIYVLNGEIEIRLGQNTLHIPVGGIVHLPKKVPHALYNPLKTSLKIMVHTIPGGLEGYFNEVDAALESGVLDAEMHTRISARYGLEWLE
ncbi:MAG TPA: cupin domain-containing protein [Anaerolineales bacterium]|nr:cupin domain-containing protein [Anaerolineales bacterium]